MTTFLPADHVSQREPGPWRDCTFASMLETIRLGLPGGRAIPATEAEKERFRAAAGFPDDHGGATIEDTLLAATRLYGLTARHYSLTRDWNTLARALEDPNKVCVVTGLMSGVPASERITPFTGAHAVAKHGVRVRCDPLGPKDGKYVGNVWPLAYWQSFFKALPGSQALVMEADGGEPTVITAGGLTLTSNKNARIVADGNILDEPNGTRVTAAVKGKVFPYMGSSSGHRAILVVTGIPYPDKVARPTILFVPNAIASIEDAPPVSGGDVKHTVSLQIDGAEKFKTTV